MNSALTKPLLVVTAVLILPLALLAYRGEFFAETLQRWQDAPPSPRVVAIGVVAMLASDVVLPVPSGPVATLAGSQLGWLGGAATSFAGMTLGAILAFALARRWGRPLAERLSGPNRFAEATDMCARHGSWLLLLARPLPVLAEASTLVVGAWQLTWRLFLPPVLAANALLGLSYSALGHWASGKGWLPLAVFFSAALPLALGTWLSRRKQV